MQEDLPAPTRRLTAADLPAIEAHLLALDESDRHKRFQALLGDDAIRDYCRRIDFAQRVVIGLKDPATGALAGLAEAHLDDAAAPEAAEVAVTVHKSRRGRAIGRRLVAALLTAAAGRGARRAEFYFQADNLAMVRLIRGLGRLTSFSLGFAAVSLAQPSAA